MANKVYLVTDGEYSDRSNRGIFSTRKLAEEYMAKCREAEKCWHKDFNDIEEWIIDEQMKETTYTRYCVGILLDDGTVQEKNVSGLIWGVPHSSSYVAEKVPMYNGRGIVRAESHRSAEHALKVAIEARQKWMREHATL